MYLICSPHDRTETESQAHIEPAQDTRGLVPTEATSELGARTFECTQTDEPFGCTTSKYIRQHRVLTSGEVVLQVEKWFAKADTFADVARESMEKKRYDFACFLAQQAVEFCLKGILIAKTGMKSYSHSLEDLTKALVATGIGIPQAVVECAKTLGEHYL